MKITLHYKFNDYYSIDHSDNIKLEYDDFPYTIEIVESDRNKTLDEIFEKYMKDALWLAVYRQMCEYSDVLSNGMMY